MINKVNKEIKLFISSIDGIDKDSVGEICEKFKTSISDNLKNGHITTNVCMIAGSILKCDPKNLATDLHKRISNLKIFENVEVAGPGFINITLKRIDFLSILNKIYEKNVTYGSSSLGERKKVQIEFVSANPTGPLHVGHGRGAAYGDALSRILKSTGYKVEKEYYVNDAGRQIDILTASVIIRMLKKELNGFFPQNAYKGEYIESIGEKFGEKIKFDDANNLIKNLSSDAEDEINEIIANLKMKDLMIWNKVKDRSLAFIVDLIKEDLKNFNVSFDNWFYESSLGSVEEQNSEISSSIAQLSKDGMGYEKDGAIWLNTEICDDDKHRVLVRKDGRATYFASDVAYHKNKIDRGFDKLINVWGADHHGYIKRIEASVEALGSTKDKLIVKLVQFANLFKKGKKIKMSTRSGDFYSLKDLIDDIGADAARFYYLSKQADQHLDFDLDLAKSDSKENIFYYIQYAHARIFSIEDKYKKTFDKQITNKTDIKNSSYIKCDELIHEISKFPNLVLKSSNSLQPHLIVFYLRDLSQLFHSFYNDNHVLSESEENIELIMFCLNGVKQTIANGLGLLGITPMKKM